MEYILVKERKSMKKRIILSLIIFTVLFVTAVLPLTADSTVWTLIRTNNKIITIENQSSQPVMVRWDTFIGDEALEKHSDYLESEILQGEIYMMPIGAKVVYIQAPRSKVIYKKNEVKEGYPFSKDLFTVID